MIHGVLRSLEVLSYVPAQPSENGLFFFFFPLKKKLPFLVLPNILYSPDCFFQGIWELFFFP